MTWARRIDPAAPPCEKAWVEHRKPITLCALTLAVFLAACGGSSGVPAPPPPGPPPPPPVIHKTVLAGPLDEPVALDVLPDGSVFVVEREGRVLLWRAGAPIAQAAIFNNLYQPPAGQNSEFGLLAIAADPAYAANGFVYVMYDAPAVGGIVEQRISRFNVVNDALVMASEAVLPAIPFDDNCCHTGGSLRFGPDGALYIATGDNTDPFIDDGFAPMDPRPGRTFGDALRSSGNTNDLRGKILRIRPTAGGSYQIPVGNLFTGLGGRPEIYAMGFRNPYTMAIDSLSGVLYVGDVGPNAGNDSAARGSRGYDEINRITEPANMGWPLFVGANFPYHAWDYGTATGGPAFDPANPVNDSPNNTGAVNLPPARPALVYYPYAASTTFPDLGTGGRNALVAGVYRAPAGATQRALPATHDGKLFISDFIRDWLVTVTLDSAGGIVGMERFAPDVTLSAPLDFDFGPDGALYVVEYGQGFFTANPDAALSRIEYSVP
jgi:cytochrome c